MSNLPEPRKHGLKQWADAIWEIILFGCDGHPENFKDFAYLAEARKRGQGDARAKIKERVQQAITTLLESNPMDSKIDLARDLITMAKSYSQKTLNQNHLSVYEIMNEIDSAESPLTWAQRTIRLMEAFATNVPFEQLKETVLAFSKPRI